MLNEPSLFTINLKRLPLGLTNIILLDRLIGQGWVFRTLVIYFYVAMEGLSILENATVLGVPFPEKLKDLLVQLRDGNKKDITDKQD